MNSSFKPKRDESYFFIYVENNEYKIHQTWWLDCAWDYVALNNLPIFKTKKQAQQYLAALQKSSIKEHLPKTFLEDFMQKYPNAELDSKGVPKLYPYQLGYCENESSCEHCYNTKTTECWNMPINL